MGPYLDFNLYLSEFDVWAAAVINDGGTPTLIIDDNSCTVPYLYDRDHDGPGDAGDGEQEFLDFVEKQDFHTQRRKALEIV